IFRQPVYCWLGCPVKHEPVFVRLNPSDRRVMMEVSALFFNDPPSPGIKSVSSWILVRFVSTDDITEQNLEVELCPHGQHWVFLFFTPWKKKRVGTRT
uniref:Uncharacterized protein n=2 Tax=Sus scrofa TaxID=9823 RepID=A0A8D0QU06_PIG